MALHILRSISFNMVSSNFFTILADECPDIANKEQFVACLRWVDEALTDHENVIGIYNVGTIDATTLSAAIHTRCPFALGLENGQMPWAVL